MKHMKTILAVLLAVSLMVIGSTALASTTRMGEDTISFNPTRLVVKTAAYTVTTSDSQVNVTTSSANIVITLPSVSDCMAGTRCEFKILKTDSTDYKVVVTPASGNTIGGESTRYIVNQNNYIVIHAGPGSDWTVDFESAYITEDHEAGTIDFNGISSTELTGDTVLVGTTPSLTIGDAGAEDAQINWDGNAVDFSLGLDDSADKLTLSKDTALGTTNIMAIANTPTTITLHDASAADAIVIFDGAAQDFHFGLDDSADDFIIGLGSALGTTPAISIDENQVVTFYQDPVLTGTTPKLTVGDAGAEDTSIVFDGNAQDFYIGLDDSADDLVIGVGSALGTTAAISIDENAMTTFVGGLILVSEVTTTVDVLTASECGKRIFLNSTTEYATTLPALSTVVAGCEFEFIVKSAASAANYTIVTGNTHENKIYGSMEVAGAVVACADEDTITLVDGNAIGDWVRLISDGTNWYLSGSTVTTAKATCGTT